MKLNAFQKSTLLFSVAFSNQRSTSISGKTVLVLDSDSLFLCWSSPNLSLPSQHFLSSPLGLCGCFHLPHKYQKYEFLRTGQGHPKRLFGTVGKAQIIMGHHILLLVYFFVGWDPDCVVWIDSNWGKGQTHFGQAVEMICNSCFSSFSWGQTLKEAMAGMLTGS